MMESTLFARDGQSDLGIPPGVVPDYNAPNIHGQSIKVVALIFIIFAFLFVTARIVVKLRSSKNLWWDDYLSVGALLAAIARLVVSFVLVDKFGIGKHIWDVPPENFTSDRNLQWVQDMIYLLGICLAKLSLLVMFITIFKPNKKFVKLCYLMMGVTISYCVIFIFLYAFDCTPEYYSWHFSIDADVQRCMPITDIITAIGAVNLATDVILLIMPLPLVAKLNLRMKQRIGVFLVFLTGVFVVITTLIRLVIVVKTITYLDPSYSVIPEINWLTIELDVAIICGCLPPLAPLYSKLFSFNTIISSWRSLVGRSTKSGVHSSTGARKLSSGANSESNVPLDHVGKDSHSTTVRVNSDTFSVPEGGIHLQQSVHQYSTRTADRMV